jgi:hypothetical protein
MRTFRKRATKMNTQEAIEILEAYRRWAHDDEVQTDTYLAVTHAIEHMKRGKDNFDKYFSCPKDTIQIQVCKFDNEKTFQVRALSYSKGWTNCMEMSSNTENIGMGNACLSMAAPEPPQERKD